MMMYDSFSKIIQYLLIFTIIVPSVNLFKTSVCDINRKTKNICQSYDNCQTVLEMENITCLNIHDLRATKDVCQLAACTVRILGNTEDLVRTNSFVHLPKLEQIFLNNSKLKVVQESAFSGLSKLMQIHLEFNEITKIHRKTFKSLNNLKILDLHSNSINEIDDDGFIDLNSLDFLDLSWNNLTIISPKVFEPLYNLKILNLSENFLKKIEESWCYSLHSLNELVLNNNLITDMANCSMNTNIQYLSLSGNYIVELNNPLFPRLLRKLILSNNQMSYLGITSLESLENLEVLDLSRNILDSLPCGFFKDLRKLVELNITKNNITKIKFGVFTGLDNLESLFMGHNYITFLDPLIFIPLKSLIYLEISYNVLDDFNIEKFSITSPNLKKIKFDSNKFTCSRLGNIIEFAEKKNITIEHNNIYFRENIFGIECVNGKEDQSSHQGNVIKISNDSKTFLNDIFQKEFKETKFFKFFNNFDQSTIFKKLEELIKFQENVTYNISHEINHIVNSDKYFFQKFSSDLSKVMNAFRNRTNDQYAKNSGNVSFQQFLDEFSNILNDSRTELLIHEGEVLSSAQKNDGKYLENVITLLEQIKLIIFLSTIILISICVFKTLQYSKKYLKEHTSIELEMPIFDQETNSSN